VEQYLSHLWVRTHKEHSSVDLNLADRDPILGRQVLKYFLLSNLRGFDQDVNTGELRRIWHG
jgi:hypothetical protein